MIVRNFEYLLALSKERHFARAAAACRISQPTLSAGIKQLEEDMDVLIVKRGQRFEGFTPEGERVLAWAQQMMDDCLRLKQELHTLKENAMQGPFRIGALTATTALVSVLTVPFGEQYAALDLSVVTEDAGRLLEGVRSGELDIAVTYIDQAPGEGLTTHLLYRERMFFLTAAQAEAKPGGRMGWDEIAGQPLCLLRSGVPDAVREELRRAQRVIETDSPAVLAAHLRSGKWSTVLPQSLAGTMDRVAGLRAVSIKKTPAEQANVGFVTARKDPLPQPVHALMELAHSAEMVTEIRAMLAAYQRLMPVKKKVAAR
ncbi:MAG: LysR family transcriptional regulator [Edaphobacter sp.]|uniref:LysR family transcriptional regulator n=1 Tax=Edaphobacter sp. TaxID=1934404 RepID=UPI00238937EB|nr:LysR family transcriptional regulator [Edaphobacter sp.]MDE1176859.1 LysR family transcriptional regulator [Edaphobacter sp.]